MKINHPRLDFVFQPLLLLIVVSLFLTLGIDIDTVLRTRLWLAGLAFMMYFVLGGGYRIFFQKPNAALIFLVLFVLFQLLRMGWGMIQLQDLDATDVRHDLFLRYVHAPLVWGSHLVLFTFAYGVAANRKRINRFLWASLLAAVFIAFSALPPLLQNGAAGYLTADSRHVFFFPAFYFHPWVKSYLLGIGIHPNQIGDLLAFGLFAAVGLIFYAHQCLHDSLRARQSGKPVRLQEIQNIIISICLKGLFAGIIAVAILLFFSRGTLLCLTVIFAIYLMALLMRFFSAKNIFFLGIVLAVLAGFLVWSGYLKSAFREVTTVTQEFDIKAQTGERSYSANLAGRHRALGIYKDYALWGVGTNGYKTLAKRYGVPWSSSVQAPPLTDYYAISHYYHLLAEEGTGAVMYFLFLLAWLGTWLKGLFTAASRFRFVMALSLGAPVVMILLHAAFNHLLQHTVLSMLVYVFMGTALAVVDKDFKHA